VATWGPILIALFKPVILPILTFLVGWIFPSPIQTAMQKQTDLNAAEQKADGPKHDVTDLDKI
jgi:hypothetical protein